MTIDLHEKPKWLHAETLDDDVLVNFFWEPIMSKEGDIPKAALSTKDENMFDYFHLMAIGLHGLYEFNRDGICVRAKSIHPVGFNDD